MSSLFDPIATEWSERPLFRIGLWGILAIVWTFLLWEGTDRLDGQQQERVRLQESLNSLHKAIANDSARLSLDAALAWHARAEQRFWKERTPALAEARWRDWLNEQLRLHAIEVRKMTVAALGTYANASSPRNETHLPASGTVLPREVTALHARLVVTFDPEKFFVLLAAIEKADPAVRIARVKIHAASPAASAEIDLVTLNVFDRRAEP